MTTGRHALLLGIAALALAACSREDTAPAAEAEKIVDVQGNISLPRGFDRWPVLGAWATASAGADAPVDEMHTVYVSPGGIESYRANGSFADGTVLVKEVRGAEASLITTGNAHWPTETKVWFVMVKDSGGRHADNPLWREGWGWALFEGGNPGKQVAESFETACQACHEPAQATDWIYEEAYPVLRTGTLAAPAWDAEFGF